MNENSRQGRRLGDPAPYLGGTGGRMEAGGGLEGLQEAQLAKEWGQGNVVERWVVARTLRRLEDQAPYLGGLGEEWMMFWLNWQRNGGKGMKCRDLRVGGGSPDG